MTSRLLEVKQNKNKNKNNPAPHKSSSEFSPEEILKALFDLESSSKEITRLKKKKKQ